MELANFHFSKETTLKLCMRIAQVLVRLKVESVIELDVLL